MVKGLKGTQFQTKLRFIELWESCILKGVLVDSSPKIPTHVKNKDAKLNKLHTGRSVIRGAREQVGGISVVIFVVTVYHGKAKGKKTRSPGKFWMLCTIFYPP